MNDDILKMAREAGFQIHKDGEIGIGDGWHIQTDIVERFADLVRADEREACAEILDRNAAACANNSMLQDVLRGNALAIRARRDHGQA